MFLIHLLPHLSHHLAYVRPWERPWWEPRTITITRPPVPWRYLTPFGR